MKKLELKPEDFDIINSKDAGISGPVLYKPNCKNCKKYFTHTLEPARIRPLRRKEEVEKLTGIIVGEEYKFDCKDCGAEYTARKFIRNKRENIFFESGENDEVMWFYLHK